MQKLVLNVKRTKSLLSNMLLLKGCFKDFVWAATTTPKELSVDLEQVCMVEDLKCGC